MLKNVIAPIQAWLLTQGRCVACGRHLNTQSIKKRKNKNEEQVNCACGRIFILDPKTKNYRRALLSEVE
jgi:predicted  nucleic acid-binding Zn-ribbon protein